MDDLPPPIKITSTPPSIPTGTKHDFFKKACNFIIKIKWTRVITYLTGAATFIYLIINYPAFQNFINHYFPNSSPVFARPVSYQGLLRSSNTGKYTLVLPSQEAYTLHFKPSTSLTSLKKLDEVVVKGNLTWEPYVIANAEVYPLNFTIPASQDQVLEPVISQISLDSPNSPNLPNLYPSLQWETTQKKVLIFTSGKRKIEQEGIYLESVQVSAFPQEFINYYIEGLKAAGFKETLNSINPEGITITYAKDDSFLTFGIKNIYKGSGNAKQLSGYKAFIEHN